MTKPKRPSKNLEHYKPLESPRMYPLELNENLHICLWSVTGEFKWTIAYWEHEAEGPRLVFVGSRPIDRRVNWNKFKSIVIQGQKLARAEWAKSRGGES